MNNSKSEQLVGNNIIVTFYNIFFDRLKENAGTISGKVIDIIPAGGIPTPEKFEKFYGKNSYHNPKLNTAKGALSVDRILIRQDSDKHEVVYPLNKKYMEWEIDFSSNVESCL